MWSLKQTFLLTSPSSTVGWAPSTSLTRLYHICIVAHVLLAFLFLQLPQNDTIPQRGGSHAPLGTRVLRNCSFYWHHSGFDDNNMGRLKKLKRIFNNLETSKINIFPWYLLDNRFNKKQTALAFCGKKMESLVTQLLIVRCYVTYLSIGITQIFIMVASIGWKVKWQLQKDWDY